jgi:hypothetical protein
MFDLVRDPGEKNKPFCDRKTLARLKQRYARVKKIIVV